MKTIISLTTIPSRVEYLNILLDSFKKQSIKPDAVELNIPRVYKRRNFPPADFSKIPDGFDVYLCDDFGPATKIIPTLQRYKGKQVRIIYCDDDRIYHSQWFEGLCALSRVSPNFAIADACRSIEDVLRSFHFPRKGFSYRLKRCLSFGMYRPYKIDIRKNPEAVAVAEGFGGVLVKPHFFPDSVFDIPNQCWPVDDIWLSANLYASDTKIKFSDKPKSQKSVPILVKGKDLGRLEDSLTITKFSGLSRRELDYNAVLYCINNLGAWQDKKKYFFRSA